MRRAWRASVWAAAAAAVAALQWGCGGSRGPEAGEGGSAAVQTLEGGGGLRVRYEVSPVSLTTAERVLVQIEARLGPGQRDARAVVAGALPGGLTLVREAPPERRLLPEGGGVVVMRFTVEPFLPGEHEIGPVTISAHGSVGGEGPALESVTSAPVRVVVSSVLPEGAAELAGEKGVVDPPALPLWRRGWVWVAAGGVLLLAGCGLLVAAAQRRRAARAAAPVMIPAHQKALRRLDALLARRLIETGRHALFVEGASQILRWYIEERFGLRAPERTTEEFLAESRLHPGLHGEDLSLLERFLSHCDMVKFAAAAPTEAEARAAAGTVRSFIERTGDDAVLAPEGPSPAGAAGRAAA